MLFKCISIILASTMCMESYLAWHPPVEPIIVEEVIVEETVSDTIDIIEEPVEVIEEITEPDETIVQSTSTNLSLSDSEIDLVALVTMAEAEGESEEGKRLVIDVILNRYESHRFPNTIEGVIYAKNAFECLWNGRVNRCHVRDDIRQLVIEELQSRTNANIHYFRTNHYHNFGIPVVNVGNHYFSTY